MLDKDKQIEEIAKEICAKCKSDTKCSRKICTMAYREAEHLFDKGYRKASEVAREIFEEVESKLTDEAKDILRRINSIKDPDAIDGLYEEVATLEDVIAMLAELKKKYTEGEK